MFPKSLRLTTKDVRYIQKVRNTIWTKHFGVLRIPQYPNRSYHQASIYIAAKIVPQSVWRHQLKRRLLVYLEEDLTSRITQNGVGYYKLFIFLNKQALTKEYISGSAQERRKAIDDLVKHFNKEWPIVAQKLRLTSR